MNLSASNIGWASEHDEEMYKFLSDNNFIGLEIAPTRIFPQAPYEHVDEARSFANKLKKTYELSISSMQSIWYGISELIFGSEDNRRKLIAYTKSAINFSSAIGCTNLVFGCPKNRATPEGLSPDDYIPIATTFFKEIGSYAFDKGVYISIEPNPPIYNTNFINTTVEAFAFCESLDSPGVKVNVDLGTMIHYSESINILIDNIDLINHVHLSEPHLAPIVKRDLHRDIIRELLGAGYGGFFSIEMGKQSDIQPIKETIVYVKEIVRDCK